MKIHTFGLDIGRTSMKAVWLSKESNGYGLLTAISTPTPEKGMLSEAPLDEEEIAKAITKFINDAKIEAKSVNIALPDNQVYTKIIEMPVLSEKELASAIYWEAEQQIPIPITDVTFDYKILRKPQKAEEGTMMDVLLVGSPTALVDKYTKILSAAGLVVNSLETDILSTIRVASLGNNIIASLIVSIGAFNTSIAVIRNGNLVLTYSIPTGGTTISRVISTDFAFALNQAEEYKKVYGLLDQNFGGKLTKAMTPVLQSIITEIRKALAFYNQKFPNDPVRQIFLSGGSAKLPGLDTFFVNAIGVETIISNPWKILSDKEVPKDIIDNAPAYTVAVGLAIKEYDQ